MGYLLGHFSRLLHWKIEIKCIGVGKNSPYDAYRFVSSKPSLLVIMPLLPNHKHMDGTYIGTHRRIWFISIIYFYCAEKRRKQIIRVMVPKSHMSQKLTGMEFP